MICKQHLILFLSVVFFVSSLYTTHAWPIAIDPIAYPYQAPGPGDKRGPCPGLNALANHGYIPHNGMVNLNDMINSAIYIASMDVALSTVASTIGFATSGSILTGLTSIGGSPGLLLGPGLDYHGGILISIEHDASVSRNDAYFGDNHSFNSTLWAQMVTLASTHPDPWGLDYFSDLLHLRITQSLATNPQFFMGPIQYIAASVTATIGMATFRLPGQPATLETMQSFFVDEALPAGYGIQDPLDVLTLVEALENVFYMWTQHPLPFAFSPIGLNTPLTFPTRAECMTCFLREALLQTTLLGTLSLNLLNGLNSLLTGSYILCDPALSC